MGSLFRSKTTAVEDPTARMAFQTVQPALATAVGGGINLYNQVAANPAYAGPRVANLNPFQINSANTLGGFSQDFAPTAANVASNAAFANLFPGMNFGSNAMDIFGRASMDPTGQIISNAGQFANNPYTQGMIDAASRDVVRNLGETVLPGINRTASGTGNLNSTRAGVESAIATRGAADRLADISSNIRGQFFGRGLEMGQNQFNQNLQNMVAANADLLRAGQFGMQGLAGAQDIAGTGFKQGQAAGGVFNAQDQAQLDANKAVFDESIRNQLAVLAGLTGTAQAGQGFRGTAGTQTQPSVASQIASLVGAFT